MNEKSTEEWLAEYEDLDYKMWYHEEFQTGK